MENPELNKNEQERNPKIEGALKELDEQAQEVAEELDEVDIEALDEETKVTLKDKVFMLIGIIEVIGGAGMMLDASIFHPENLRGMHHALEILGSRFISGAGVELAGIGVLIGKYDKLKQLFKQ